MFTASTEMPSENIEGLPGALGGRHETLVMRASMCALARVAAVVGVVLAAAAPAGAQDAPPPIGPFVVDLRGVVPKFGSNPDLAASRGLDPAQLPGVGFGAAAGVHVYFPKWARDHIRSRRGSDRRALALRSAAGGAGSGLPVAGAAPGHRNAEGVYPQLSLNFGNGNGWSYLSVGVGRVIWSIAPDVVKPLPANEEVLSTISYGGGARWFMKKHLAFSLDVRLYDIGGGTPELGYPASPGTVLFVIAAGISVK